MCAVAALLIPVCYLLGSSLGGSRVGLLSALGAAVFPHWLYFSGSILSDLSTALLVGLTTWLLIGGSRRDSLPWISAGRCLSRRLTGPPVSPSAPHSRRIW
jgi:4-amino-4-deoxy-L-arabinose transferase-like glycosyltransferase